MNILDRLALLPLIVSFVLYPAVAVLVLRLRPSQNRNRAFAATNVAGAFALCFAATLPDVIPSVSTLPLYVGLCSLIFAIYLLTVCGSFLILRPGAEHSSRWAWPAFLFPLILLVIKYIPAKANPFEPAFHRVGNLTLSGVFIGSSYMAFRLSHLVREVQNKVVPFPSFSEYLAFAFFVPGILSGPISPYSRMYASLRCPEGVRVPVTQSVLRIVVGLTKYLFLATILNQFTYSGLLLDGHPHGRIDLVIAIFAYTGYLYCNFSGFCDMVVGVSGLLNVDIAENFDRPFAARNLQEFWTRWHMTLSTWFRDMMFTPLLKTLVRFLGPAAMDHAVALVVVIVFVAVGVWHGSGLNYVIFGLANGVGLAAVHYYTVWLKRRLGKQQYRAYQASRIIRGLSTCATFIYFSLCVFFFANSPSDATRILAAIR